MSETFVNRIDGVLRPSSGAEMVAEDVRQAAET